MQDIYSYLCSNNDPNNIYTFSSKKLFWDWKEEIKEHKTLLLKSAILVFVGFNKSVLYVGSTELVKTYINVIRAVNGLQINTIYVVLEEPINLLHKTKECRQLFLPNKNSYTGNNKFIAQKDENYLVLSLSKRQAVEWILNNHSAPFDEFICLFSYSVITSLCRSFKCTRHNLSELQHAIKNNKKIIKYI